MHCSAALISLLDVYKRQGNYNPHIWLSPSRYLKQVDNLCSAIAAQFPQYADCLLYTSEIGNILGLDQNYPTILIGAGNLGRAVATHMSFETRGFSLVGLFDNSPAVVGQTVRGLTVRHIEMCIRDRVYNMLAENGALADLIAAGARILECACSPCIGTVSYTHLPLPPNLRRRQLCADRSPQAQASGGCRCKQMCIRDRATFRS